MSEVYDRYEYIKNLTGAGLNEPQAEAIAKGAVRVKEIKGIILALSLFITMPAAAQTFTVTLSASGDCAGTPTICGTSSDRNGDRDTTWPGLQVDEGDIITATTSVIPAVSGSHNVVGNIAISGSAHNRDDLRAPSGGRILAGSSFLLGEFALRNTATTNPSGEQISRVLVYSDMVVEGDETLTYRIRNIGSFSGATVSTGTPSSVTITIRGTNTAPAFRDSVTAKVFPNNTPINLTIPEATGGNGPVSYTTTNLPAGLSFQGDCGARTFCGTPTTLGTTTIEITAADADMHTTGDTDILSFDLRIADAYRLADLDQNGSLDDTDAFNLFRAYLRIPNVDATISQRATDWKENGRAQGGDLNSDGPINHRDALIMYYAYEFGDLLDQSAVLRQLLLNGVRGRMPDTDATYRELLRRARGLQ